MTAAPPPCWNGEGGFAAFGRFMCAALPRLLVLWTVISYPGGIQGAMAILGLWLSMGTTSDRCFSAFFGPRCS